MVGDWITLKKGEPKDMEVIIGEVPGGVFCSMLTVEVKGAEYERNREQAPILPIFKTSEPSRDLMDNIYEWLTFDHASLTGGPVFRDIPNVVAEPVPVEPGVEVQGIAVPHPETRRLWSMADGRRFEADYMCSISGKAVFETVAGRQVKMDKGLLSQEDQNYIELSNPPRLDATFTKQSSQRIIETTPFLNEVPPRIIDYLFGAKIRQVSARAYGHRLKAELFVLGQQRIDGNKFILLDRQSSTFVLDGENGRAHVFKGGPVEVMAYDTTQPLGRKYSDYLLLVTDQRGEVIHHSASANWLLPNLENLRKLKVGNFMDKTCRRVFPTGPGPRSLYY